MRTNLQPENDHRTVTARQEPVAEIGSGAVCQECLNEDFDSCVCPEPGN